jgi:hypothetical protein
MPPRGRGRRNKTGNDATPRSSVTVERPQNGAQTRRRRLLVGATIVIVVLAFAVRLLQLANEPHVFLLANEGGAEWIRANTPFVLGVYPHTQTFTAFQTTFTTAAPVSGAQLTVYAFRRAAVALDGAAIDPGAKDIADWKDARTLALPSPLPAGRHVLRIDVANRDAVCCLLAYSPQLDLRTGPGWQAAPLRQPAAPAVAASDVRLPEPAGEFPA